VRRSRARRATRSAALAIGIVAVVLAAAACAPKREVTGWVPYWNTDAGRATVEAQRDLLSEVSPFWFRATSATALVSDEPPAEQATVVAAARAGNIPVIPAVRDGMPARAMAAVLADPAQRAAHVAALVKLVEANGYAGIDLDYEQFAFSDGTSTWAATRPTWVQFVADLGAQLHARARLLTVTTPPIYNGTRAPGSGYWVYDWAGIAPHVDRLRIMSYDYSFSAPGPISPIWWVDQIVAYAVKVVPPSKIQIGVPTYGRSWVTGITGTCPVGANTARFDVRMVNAPALVQQKHAVPVRDGRSGELTFTYIDTFTGAPPPPTTVPGGTTVAPPAQVTCQVARRVWYPDTASVLAHARIVGAYGISGLAQWSLGFEAADQWPALRDHAGTLPHPAGVDPIGALEGTKAGSKRITVSGWGLDPETDLPVRVAISTASTRQIVLANAPRTDIAQRYPGAGPFHGFAATVPAPPGAGFVCLEVLGVGAGVATRGVTCANVAVPA
jgi:spore germination protein YaaH